MKKILKPITYFLAFFLSLYLSGACAGVFNIVPKAGTVLPTQVPRGGTVNAVYTITNTTGSTHSGNYLKYLPTNVTQVFNDLSYSDLCGATFTLGINATCTLELSVSGPVNGSDPDPKHHLFACLGGCTTCCSGTKFPLNVLQVSPVTPPTVSSFSPVNAAINVSPSSNISVTFSIPMATTTLIPNNFQLYDTTTPGFVSLVSPVYTNSNTSVTFGTSTPLASGHTYQIIIPQPSNVKSAAEVPLTSGGVLGTFDVAIWSANSCNQVWVLNHTNSSITNCYYDDNDNGLNSCTGNGQNAGSNLNRPTAMWWDPLFGLSVTNGAGSNPFVQLADTAVGSSSPLPPYTGTIIAGSNTMNPVGVSSYGGAGWIANANGTLTYCTNAPNSGAPPLWSGCTVSTPSGYSPNATSLNIAQIPSTFRPVLYTANTNSNTISLCLINNSNVITGCSDAGGSGFNHPTSISAVIYSPSPSLPRALITNSGDNTVLQCQIDPSTFLLSSCVPTGSNFNQPSSVFVNQSTSPWRAYVTNAGDNSVTVCSDTDGVLTDCVRMFYGFDTPASIVVENLCL